LDSIQNILFHGITILHKTPIVTYFVTSL